MGEPATHGETVRTLQDVFTEAHERDEIARQYLRQGEIRVNLPGLGEQTALYTHIDPPASRESSREEPKPPIFLIPGVSNDIDCVGALAQEIAYAGRSVVVVGFPESFMGSTTESFAKAVKDTPNYGPHTDFYKESIDALLGSDSDFELWGFSTGAPISAEILNDPRFQERVNEAVLLSPASSVDQTSMQINTGTASEGARLLKRFSTLGKYTFSMGRNKNVEQQPQEQKKRRGEIFKSLMKKVQTKTASWEGAKVKDGGNIVVISGGKDQITKSYRVEDDFRKNPQMEVVHLPNAYHSTPLTEPQETVEKIFAQQEEFLH